MYLDLKYAYLMAWCCWCVEFTLYCSQYFMYPNAVVTLLWIDEACEIQLIYIHLMLICCLSCTINQSTISIVIFIKKLCHSRYSSPKATNLWSFCYSYNPLWRFSLRPIICECFLILSSDGLGRNFRPNKFSRCHSTDTQNEFQKSFTIKFPPARFPWVHIRSTEAP